MRCSSRRVSALTLLIGGGAFCILLGLFSTLEVPGLGGRPAAGDRGHPSKTLRLTRNPRNSTPDHSAGTTAGNREGTSPGENQTPRHQSKTADREADKLSKLAAGNPDIAAAIAEAGHPSQLRQRLLERAGTLAVHEEDPWKSLVLVAQTYHRAGEREAAEAWFERAQRLAIDPDSEIRTSSALRDVMNGWLSIARFDKAEAIMQTIPNARYRDLASAELATALTGKKRFLEATRLATSLRDATARAL